MLALVSKIMLTLDPLSVTIIFTVIISITRDVQHYYRSTVTIICTPVAFINNGYNVAPAERLIN